MQAWTHYRHRTHAILRNMLVRMLIRSGSVALRTQKKVFEALQARVNKRKLVRISNVT